MIRKRTVVALCACVFSSLLSFAQSASQRPYRIGLLSDTTYFSEHATALQWDAGEQLVGLRQGMKDLGVVEGKDWILIPRIANREHALLDPNTDGSADEAVIRAIVAETAEAFNRQDPAGTVAHRTADFDHINVAGVWGKGKDHLQTEMIEYFKTHHPNMTTSVEKIRFLTPDVAYAIVKRQYKDDKGTRDAISTSVFQKINEHWWEVAFQNTFIQPPPQQTSSTPLASVEQEIKQLEEERRQAVLHQEVEKLKRFYADGMTIIDIDGDFHVNANNASPNLNQPATRTTLKWIIDDIAVKPYGLSAAIVTIRAETEDVLKGIHRNFIQRLMHIWVKRDGEWQIVARHGTEIAAELATPAGPQQPVSNLPHETEITKPATLTPEQQEIFDFHRKLHDAHWSGDVASLKQLLTDDWFVARPSGQIITREQFLTSVNPGAPPRLQDEIRIRTLGEVAVMTLRTTWSDGRVQRGTEVFVRENGDWKQAANQQTLVKASAGSTTAASSASTTDLDPVKLTPDDEAPVRDALAAFVAAFSGRDRARLNQLRTPDVDRRSNQNGEILMLGDQSRGTPVMNNPSDNQEWTRAVDKMRFLTPDVALVDTHGDETRTNAKTGEVAVRHVFNTYIMTRGTDGLWRVAASRY